MFKWCTILIAIISVIFVWYKLQIYEDNVADGPIVADNHFRERSVQPSHLTSATIETSVANPTLATVSSETIEQQISEITLSQLSAWIYEGNESDKWRALSYLLEFEHASVPLLLNIIHGNNQLALKEHAIALLADIDPTLLSSIKANLLADDQLIPIMSTLSIVNQPNNLTDYRIGLIDLENNQTTSLITDLMTDNNAQKVSAIEQLSWANFADMKAVLDWVILHDHSSLVRRAAIAAGLTFDSEHQQEWLRKGLHDADHEVQAFALQHIQTSGIDINFFIADFIGILYSSSDEETSDKVAELLLHESSPLGIDVLTQIRSNQSLQSSN